MKNSIHPTKKTDTMPVKNRPYFVPASFPQQPDYYTDIFHRVNAVFSHPYKDVTLYVEVCPHTFGDNPFDISGPVQLLYQAKDCRRSLDYREFDTLREALVRLTDFLQDPHFGEKYSYPPVKANHDVKYLPKPKKTNRPRRKGNGGRYLLTDRDKTLLLSWGYKEDEYDQIAEAANKATYVILDDEGNDKETINIWEAIDLLGQENFLSGIARSAFHQTCARESKDGKTSVWIDASVLFR